MKSKPYKELRDTIQTGDCIQWKSHGVIPWIIQRWSEYSHSSLVVRLNKYENLRDRIFLVEALSGGLTFTCLSGRLDESSGRAFLFQLRNMDDDKRATIHRDATIALSQRIKYDFKSLFANVFGRVSNDASRYFCSEFVWAKWDKSGALAGEMTALGLEKHLQGKAPRPGDIPLWAHGATTEILK